MVVMYKWLVSLLSLYPECCQAVLSSVARINALERNYIYTYILNICNFVKRNKRGITCKLVCNTQRHLERKKKEEGEKKSSAPFYGEVRCSALFVLLQISEKLHDISNLLTYLSSLTCRELDIYHLQKKISLPPFGKLECQPGQPATHAVIAGKRCGIKPCAAVKIQQFWNKSF